MNGTKEEAEKVFDMLFSSAKHNQRMKEGSRISCLVKESGEEDASSILKEWALKNGTNVIDALDVLETTPGSDYERYRALIAHLDANTVLLIDDFGDETYGPFRELFSDLIKNDFVWKDNPFANPTKQDYLFIVLTIKASNDYPLSSGERSCFPFHLDLK
jgi:hypothetical protein